MSLRAKRGNLGGVWDCFGTACLAMTEGDVPRNDRGGASLRLSIVVIASLLFIVIASPFLLSLRAKRGNLGSGIASSLALLAMTKRGRASQ